MRLASYQVGERQAYGAVIGDQIVELSTRLPYPDLASALPHLDEVRAAAAAAETTVRSLSEVSFLPPVVRPPRILCVGRNFKHALTCAKLDFPAYPILFARFAPSQVGHQQAIVRPSASAQFDYEGELAVVIGRRGRHIAEAEALQHVAGYSCYNDGSVRDYQRHTSQDTPGKNFWRSGAMGPWLTTADEIPDPSSLMLTTRLNGEVVQHECLGDLLFPVPSVLAYLSRISPLEPGDIIALGTPFGAGVNQDPPRWLVPGDEVSVTIDAIGTLTNRVVDETEAEGSA